MAVNRVQFMGMVGTQPEEMVFDSGMRQAKFRLAVRTTKKQQDHTSWYSVVCWDRMVDRVSHINKGDLVYVEGPIVIDEYEYKGSVRTTVEINCKDAHVIKKQDRQERDTHTVETVSDALDMRREPNFDDGGSDGEEW